MNLGWYKKLCVKHEEALKDIVQNHELGKIGEAVYKAWGSMSQEKKLKEQTCKADGFFKIIFYFILFICLREVVTDFVKQLTGHYVCSGAKTL